jgi:hypothetical protein
MITYGDKTNGIVVSDNRFILVHSIEYDDVTFKTSYLVVTNIKCNGKIIALFDLTILGNVEAAEIDVQGKLVCLGECNVSGSIVVQNEIWANDVRANKIECHDRIVAQEIECDTIIADGSIIVGKTLAIEKLARSEMNILCGETAYGTGNVAAKVIVTGEPLDLDTDGEAIESPNRYIPAVSSDSPNPNAGTDAHKNLISLGKSSFAPKGDFLGYLSVLLRDVFDEDAKVKFLRWHDVLSQADAVKRNSLSSFADIALIVWLAEIVWSEYFKDWFAIRNLFDTFESHFKCLVDRDKDSVMCSIDSYDNWLEALAVLRKFGMLIDKSVYNTAFELTVSNLGLKAKFISARLHEKGWEAHGQ